MSSLDLLDLLGQSEAYLARAQRGYGAGIWRAVKGGSPPDEGAHHDRIERILADDTVLVRLEAAYRREGIDALVRRRAARWLSAALVSQIDSQTGALARRRQTAALLGSFSGAVGRERLDVDGLRVTLARDNDRGRREQAYRALTGLAQSLLPIVHEGVALAAGAWSKDRPGRDTTFWRQPLSPFALDWPEMDLPGMVASFLAQTEPLLERFHHLGTRGGGVRSLQPWDWEHAVLQLAAPYERYFPPADHAASLARATRACGLIIDTQPLSLELAPKWLPQANSGWPATDWLAVGMSRESRAGSGIEASRLLRPELGLAVDGRLGSQASLGSLARATGTALGVLLCRAGYLAERRIAGGIDPAAVTLAALLTEPNFLAGQTSMPRSEISSYLAVGSLEAGVLRAVRLRRIAALAAAAWQVVLAPGTDPGPVAAHWLREATGVTWDGGVAGLDLATLVDLAYWPATFLAELARGQIVGYLRREHGRLMGERRTGECLVECFWRYGGLATSTRAIELATGHALDGTAEAETLLREAGM